MIMALWDSAFIFDFESSGTYQSMVHQNISTQGGISGSEKISFGFVIAFSTLQVRLEIQNYKFGEGFFVVLKRWWTDSHQDETNERGTFLQLQIIIDPLWMMIIIQHSIAIGNLFNGK